MGNLCKNSGSPTDKNEVPINYYACRPKCQNRAAPLPYYRDYSINILYIHSTIVVLKHFCREINLEMIISRTPKTGRKKEGLQVTGSIANSSCCCCPTSGTGDNIPY